MRRNLIFNFNVLNDTSSAFYYSKNAHSILVLLCQEISCVAAIRAVHFSCVALLRTFLFSGVKIMDKTINQRIRYYRKLRQLTQIEVASKLGIKSSTYSQCERRGKIPCELLIELSKILEVSCNTLLFGEDSEIPIIPDPETFDCTSKEISLIKVMRILTDKKHKAAYKIIELIWKNQLDPFLILKDFKK